MYIYMHLSDENEPRMLNNTIRLYKYGLFYSRQHFTKTIYINTHFHIILFNFFRFSFPLTNKISLSFI